MVVVARTGAERTRCVARRRREDLETPAAKCFLDRARRSLSEERLGRDASSGCSLAASTGMLSGVSGRLTKKTLSSLVESSSSGVPARTDFASTRAGKCFSSGTTLLKPLPSVMDPRFLVSVRSLVILVVKNCVYSASQSARGEHRHSLGAQSSVGVGSGMALLLLWLRLWRACSAVVRW